jgi:hypothetical protein
LELEEFWGHSTAKKLFNKKGIILSAHFDSVWWVGYDWAMSGYPKTFRTIITKQIYGWCSCNSKLSLWEENVRIQCPQCRYDNENSKHLTQYRDLGSVLQLHNSIETIMDILDNAKIVSKLTNIIMAHLLNQG